MAYMDASLYKNKDDFSLVIKMGGGVREEL